MAVFEDTISPPQIKPPKNRDVPKVCKKSERHTYSKSVFMIFQFQLY